MLASDVHLGFQMLIGLLEIGIFVAKNILEGMVSQFFQFNLGSKVM